MSTPTNTTTPTTAAQAEENQNENGNALLPLGWTRVKRRRTTTTTSATDTATTPTDNNNKKKNNNAELDDDDDNDCCIDCRQYGIGSSGTAAFAMFHQNYARNRQKFRLVQGTAIFCLPDPDSDWFQGHLLVNGSRSSLGLLCTKKSVDACLQCALGGYQELELQVFLRGNKGKGSNTIVDKVICTGGDFMQWHSDRVRLQIDQLYTGHVAFPKVATFFAGLVLRQQQQQQQQQLDSDSTAATTAKTNNNKVIIDSEDVEAVMPNVAVVSGTMQLWLPRPDDDVDDDDNNNAISSEGKRDEADLLME